MSGTAEVADGINIPAVLDDLPNTTKIQAATKTIVSVTPPRNRGIALRLVVRQDLIVEWLAEEQERSEKTRPAASKRGK